MAWQNLIRCFDEVAISGYITPNKALVTGGVIEKGGNGMTEK